MAIAVNGGHVSRAIDFHDTPNKYFIIGGSEPWKNEPSPDLPELEDFKLNDVIGLQRIAEFDTYLVVPDEKGTIKYKDQNWRKVTKEYFTTVGAGGVINGSTVVPVDSVEAMNIGNKLRIGNVYEGVIVSMEGNNVTLDTESPATIDAGSIVQGGALVEGAKYVYVEAWLEYDKFPLATYRQIGLCTEVKPANVESVDMLRSAAFNPAGVDEYESLGVLEILDNRPPIPRDSNMRELISMIIEF